MQTRCVLQKLKGGSVAGSVVGDLKHHLHTARVLELIIPRGTDVHQSHEIPLPQTSSINGNRVKSQFRSRYRFFSSLPNGVVEDVTLSAAGWSGW